MTLDREAILEAAREGVREALDKHHLCRYGLNPDEMAHAVTMIKTIGEGDFAKGIEQIKENHNFVKRWINRLEDGARVIARGFLTAMVGALLLILWLGIKIKLMSTGGN